LTELAVAEGFDRTKVSSFLSSNQGVDEVRALETGAIERGVNSVPSVRVASDIVTGAQSVALFRATLEGALNGSATPA
jgi:predicted DsbA family dithiol-disulfide isomerase